MPDGLTPSPDGKTLYVALGGENALAVIDLDTRKVARLHPDRVVSGRRRDHARRPAAGRDGSEQGRRPPQPLRGAVRGRRLQHGRPDLREHRRGLDPDDDQGRR